MSLSDVGSLAFGSTPIGAAARGMEQVDKLADTAGGKVTDVLAGGQDEFGNKLPPEAAAAGGTAANIALQSLPMLAGGGLAKTAAPVLRGGAESLLSSALKPTLRQLKSGEAATAIDTMLSEGINATKGGVEALKSKIGEVNTQIAEAIANSPERIRTGEVGKALLDTMKRFQNQVNPQTDIDTIKNAWAMFKNHPLLNGATDMSVQMAQALKQGTYRILSKKYGQLGSAEEEAQKALARGLKDEVSAAVPGIAELNLKDSQLISALNVAERRSLMDMNKNPAGLALLTHNPASFMAFMADKSALFKSLIARMLNAGQEQIPATAARVGIAGREVSQQE